MNSQLFLILQLIFLWTIHYIGDFMLQTHWQATNKSKNNLALTLHVLSYSFTFLFFGCTAAMLGCINGDNVIKFCLVNGCLHWITDYYTSRASSKLFARSDWHNFFLIIGGDQLIHYIFLTLTYYYIILKP